MNGWFHRSACGRPRAASAHAGTRGLLTLALAVAVVVAVAWSGPAAASVLYRCVGAGGVTAYVSHTAGYRQCVKVGEWGTPRARLTAFRQSSAQDRSASAPKAVPGPAPKPVGANPAVLKITPLRDDDAVPAAPPPALQPLPVVALDTLASWVLPRVLGVDLAPVRESPAPAAGVAPAPASTAALAAAAPASPPPIVTPVPPRTGAVYRVLQKNGTVLYTNIASLARGHEARMLFTYIVECYACNVHSKVDWDKVPLHLADYDNDVDAAAHLSGVDPALLRAVIHAESGFNPHALSYKGAQGLMQLMPGTAFELGVGDAFDPAQNISGGARYLAMLMHEFHGNVTLAAAAYNAGAAAVAKYRGIPPYAETKVYVQRVQLLYGRYQKALAGRVSPTLATAARTD